MASYKKIEERKENEWIIKADVDLKKKMDELRRIRFANGLDEKPAPYKDILGAAFRFPPLLEILKKAEFVKKDNKKGQTFNLFTFIIFSFLVVVFFGGLIYAMGLINTTMHNVGLSNEVNIGSPMYVNMTQASDQIFGQVYQSILALRMVALVYILGLATCIILTNAFMKKNPIWFFAYILISVLAIIFSPPVSNAYEQLLNSGIYDGGLTSFTASNFILLNLPTIVMVIGILGGLFLFINLIRTGGEDPNL